MTLLTLRVSSGEMLIMGQYGTLPVRASVLELLHFDAFKFYQKYLSVVTA